MDVIESFINKEGFWKWIMVSTLVFIIFNVIVKFIWGNYYIKRTELDAKEAANKAVFQPEIIIDRVCSTIVSDMCILSVCFFYNLFISHFSFAVDFNCFVLLGMIVLDLLINNLIEKELGLVFSNKAVGKELGCLEKDKDAIPSLRILSSFAVLLLLIFLMCKYKKYDQLVICVAGLVLGRIIYFDSSIKSCLDLFQVLQKYILYAMIAWMVTIIIVILGLSWKVIDKDNLFLGILVCHLFFLCAIKAGKELMMT